jgi:hypothetical protein
MLAFVGLVAFSVSFVAIRAFALREGWSPVLASAAPLLVDTLTVLGASIVLARARDGDRALYGWGLVAAASSVSLAVNVAHARAHLSAQLLAALPPVALLASAEAVLSEARRAQRRRTAPAGQAPAEQALEPERTPEPARTPRRPLSAVPDLGKRAAGRTGQRAHAEQVWRTLEADERTVISGRAFAQRAGISPSYAAEVLGALRSEQGNGQRPADEQGGES